MTPSILTNRRQTADAEPGKTSLTRNHTGQLNPAQRFLGSCKTSECSTCLAKMRAYFLTTPPTGSISSKISRLTRIKDNRRYDALRSTQLTEEPQEESFWSWSGPADTPGSASRYQRKQAFVYGFLLVLLSIIISIL